MIIKNCAFSVPLPDWVLHDNDHSGESDFNISKKNLKNHKVGGGMDRTSSMPKSVLRLKVDKGQGLQSGILFFTSLVQLPIECREES